MPLLQNNSTFVRLQRMYCMLDVLGVVCIGVEILLKARTEAISQWPVTATLQ